MGRTFRSTRVSAAAAALLVVLSAALGASAQPRALFADSPAADAGSAQVPGPDPQRPAGVVRSRQTVLDLGVLLPLVGGGDPGDTAPREVLFNLFEDAVVAVSVDRVGTPALSPGYVLSGSTPDGLGTAVLVVHLAPGGGVGAVSGAVRSPLGFFSISSAGPGLLSIGEVGPVH